MLCMISVFMCFGWVFVYVIVSVLFYELLNISYCLVLIILCRCLILVIRFYVVLFLRFVCGVECL